MATAKPIPTAAPARRPVWRRVAVAVLGLLVLALALGWPPLHQRARRVAATAAREVCACRHISGRALGDCRKDLGPGQATLWLSEDASGRAVTARVLPVASETATYLDGAGCQLGPWRE